MRRSLKNRSAARVAGELFTPKIWMLPTSFDCGIRCCDIFDQVHMSKTHFSLLLLYCCASSFSFGQAPPIMVPQPLPLTTQYLSLTTAQVQAIVQNNNAFNQFSSGKQARIYQVQAEI